MSLLWRYVILKTTKSKKATAKTSISSDGRSAALHDATNLINHLGKFHVKDHQEFLLAKGNKDTKQKTTGETLQDMHVVDAQHVA